MLLNSQESPTYFIQDKLSSGDELGRRPFAQTLFKMIFNETGGQPLVIAITGSWGLGKSNTLEFIKEEFARATRDQVKALRHSRLVEYSPWRYADDDSIIYHLFEKLVNAINQEDAHLSRMQRLIKRLPSWLAPLLRFCGDVLPGSGPWLAGFSSLVSPENFSKHLESVREATREYLAKCEGRLVMLIDDVDRLEPDDVMKLFRVLKLTTDLPNTTFIVSMDEVHVSKVIGKKLGGDEEDGRRYLEKIFNAQLRLPTVNQDLLQEYALNMFTRLWVNSENTTISENESVRVSTIFNALHEPFIRTPRTVKSIRNAFSFAVVNANDELNTGDLLLLEATRILQPRLYQAILEWMPTVPITNDSAQLGESASVALSKLQEAFSNEEQTKLGQVETAFKTWFPQLIGIGTFNEREQRQNRRLCSPDYMDRYFSSGISSKVVLDSTVRSWLHLVPISRNSAGEYLTAHLSKPYARDFIRKVEFFAEEDWFMRLPILLVWVEVVGKDLKYRTNRGLNVSLFQASANLAVNWISELPKQSRAEVALEVVRKTQNLEWNFTFARLLHVDDSVFDFSQIGKSPGLLDEEMALQSLKAYEAGELPTTDRMIRQRIWTLFRHASSRDFSHRLQKVLESYPEVAIHVLAGGCSFDENVGLGRACWGWQAAKGLDQIEKMVPKEQLSLALNLARPKERPANLKVPEHEFDYNTLEEVKWLCLDTIEIRRKKELERW